MILHVILPCFDPYHLTPSPSDFLSSGVPSSLAPPTYVALRPAPTDGRKPEASARASTTAGISSSEPAKRSRSGCPRAGRLWGSEAEGVLCVRAVWCVSLKGLFFFVSVQGGPFRAAALVQKQLSDSEHLMAHV